MTSLIHGEYRPDLTAPDFVVLPEGMTRDEAEHIHAAALTLRDHARDAIKAGA